ncbi:MAG: DUF4863 family protein [Planctomycetota bacterium]
MSTLPPELIELAEQVRPLAELLRELSIADPTAATAELARVAPCDGPLVSGLRDVVFAGAKAGWLLPKEHGGIRFGRVAKDLAGFSVDAVWLGDAPGPRHVHPNGEIDLLWTETGTPKFDGHDPGWAVYAPGSEHVPAVTGGSMLILYFLPGGAIEWR